MYKKKLSNIRYKSIRLIARLGFIIYCLLIVIIVPTVAIEFRLEKLRGSKFGTNLYFCISDRP